MMTLYNHTDNTIQKLFKMIPVVGRGHQANHQPPAAVHNELKNRPVLLLSI